MTVYSNPNIKWSDGVFSYDGLGKVPSLKPIQDTRLTTIKTELLALFKQHARIDHALDDTLIGLYLGAAVSRWEQYTLVPVYPKAYLWDVPASYRGNATHFEVPLYNCSLVGEQYGFELLSSRKIIAAPKAWPVKIEVGFLQAADMPDDVIIGIFEIALFLYEQRSTPEMTNGMLLDTINPIIQRYWVPRC
jgi:hypothetical protein